MELLVDDGFEERLEGRVLALEFELEGAGAFDELAEFGIGCSEFAAGFGGGVADGASSIDHDSRV
jgi:hypothetical protein